MIQEIFLLCAPQELKVDIGRLVVTEAAFYAYHCGCGNAFTSKEIFSHCFKDEMRCFRYHKWFKNAYSAFKVAIAGRDISDADKQGIKMSKLMDSIDGSWNRAWSKFVLVKHRADVGRRERFKLMWKYMLCMYSWESINHDFTKTKNTPLYWWRMQHENRFVFGL